MATTLMTTVTAAGTATPLTATTLTVGIGLISVVHVRLGRSTGLIVDLLIELTEGVQALPGPYVDGDGKVTSWVGYRNLPEGLENFAPARAYAVTHVVWADRDENDPLNYEIADVVGLVSSATMT